MSNNIDGVEHIQKESYSIFYVSSLSESFKSAIRSHLSAVCHGPADAASGRMMYCYKNTLTEFIKRYENKTDEQKKGMIGELLLHILLLELLDNYEVNSPFFNVEERNVKKGFDVVLNKKGTTELWLAEVKSGELHTGKNSSQTVVDLINTAQNDLNSRLNGDSNSLWLNAIHGAKIAIQESRDDRAAIISILEDNGDRASSSNLSSNDFNVILVGTLFSTLIDSIQEAKVSEKHTRVVNNNYFNNVYLIAIQKETYWAVYNFLKSESSL